MSDTPSSVTPRIDAHRLWAALEEVSTFGGTEDGGLHRLCASAEDGAARDWLAAAGREAGLDLRVDRIGNMFLRRAAGRGAATGAGVGDAGGSEAAGTDSGTDEGAVLFGSHLDSQPAGGRYDGVYGVIAGLEVMRALRDAGIATRRPFELVNWTDEEGARFAPSLLGSSVYSGKLSPEDALDITDSAGLRLGDELARIGWAGTDAVTPAEHAAYVELHIEQGPILEAEGLDLAVVPGVQGMGWMEVEVHGARGHAGTTPMELRRDAMVAAARIVTGVQGVGLARPGDGRATVGVLEISDPAPNVVPDRVRLMVEVRHPTEAPVMAAEVEELARQVGRETGCAVRVDRLWDSDPVVFDDLVLAEARAAVTGLGRPLRELASGAGHDACEVAKHVPAGMIFVPCVDGISHAPQERITPEWAAAGAQALLDTLLRIDAKL